MPRYQARPPHDMGPHTPEAPQRMKTGSAGLNLRLASRHKPPPTQRLCLFRVKQGTRSSEHPVCVRAANASFTSDSRLGSRPSPPAFVLTSAPLPGRNVGSPQHWTVLANAHHGGLTGVETTVTYRTLATGASIKDAGCAVPGIHHLARMESSTRRSAGAICFAINRQGLTSPHSVGNTSSGRNPMAR